LCRPWQSNTGRAKEENATPQETAITIAKERIEKVKQTK